jgi:hypothetical protein
LASSNINRIIPDEEGYSFIDLENAMKKTLARRIITILDCCFSGAAELEGKSSVEEAAVARGR